MLFRTNICDIATSLIFFSIQESKVEERKLKIIEKMEEKGMTAEDVAKAIQFDNPMVLGLYLVKDAYPIPARIIDKIEASLAN